MMTKREAVKAILEGKGADRIPVIMNACSLPPVQYGYTMPEVLMNPDKMVECMTGSRDRLGYDGLMIGIYGVAGDIAGHLLNKEGNVSMTGEDTIHSLDDLKNLKPYDPEQSFMLKQLLAAIKKAREVAPEEPLFVIVHHPMAEAFNLVGAKLAFKSMVKNPDFLKAVAAAVEDAVYKAHTIISDAGVDFLWYPTPNFGGYCISRKTYENVIAESNIRHINRMKAYGTPVVLHTCGLYDDRFDLVLKENGDAWHISDTSTKTVKEKYGEQVSLMGSIPCVSVLLEGTEQEVYDFCYKECMDGAKDGRFILSGDCDVPPATPDANIRAAVRAAKDAEKVLFGNR